MMRGIIIIISGSRSDIMQIGKENNTIISNKLGDHRLILTSIRHDQSTDLRNSM